MDKSVECPLCCETFSTAHIEAHASTCGLVEKKTPALKRNISDISDGTQAATDTASAKKLKVSGNNPRPGSRETKRFFKKEGNHEEDSRAEAKISTKNEPASTDKDLNASKSTPYNVGGGAPLAELMRPKDFEGYIGQEKVVGSGTQLRKLLDSDSMPSLILWGPPGCGKTSLANVIANKVKGRSKFVKMSACTCGVAEVREVVKQAKNELAMFKRKTILFMDEVHRFNKAQQDAFLPHIESGVITFIGATTENPSFSLNAALLSRSRVVVLDKLSPDSLYLILERTLRDNKLEISSKSYEKGTVCQAAVKYLCNIVDGDARSAINTLQVLLDSRTDNQHVGLDDVKEAAKRSHILYDRTGDQHYFMASALQKSIRGSDDNAALYWLGRMLKGGEDPTFIARRLVRCASEDIGLGDPTALPLAVSAFQGCQLIGRPECDVLLAQATVHLARAKKSHEVYKALAAVYKSIDQGSLPAVPLHLRNATSQLAEQLGWGRGYSHDLQKVQSISYLPEELEGTNFFREK